MFKKLLSRIYRFIFPITPVEMYQKMGVKIGDNCKIQFDVIIDHSHYWHITIGDNVTIAPRVHILAHDASTYNHLGYTRIANTIIGNNVFIGAGSLILPGVVIGDNAIIGAGSVVTKDVPAGMVYGGNPAKKICSLDEFIVKTTSQLKNSSKFDESYTIRNKISSIKKDEMIKKIDKNVGFVK